LEIVAAIKRLGQHDLWICIPRLQGYGLFQPFLRVVQPIGKQCNAPQLEGCRIVLGILSSDLRVKFAGLGKLPGLKQPIGRIDFWLLRLECRFSRSRCRGLRPHGAISRGNNRDEADASSCKFHLDRRFISRSRFAQENSRIHFPFQTQPQTSDR